MRIITFDPSWQSRLVDLWQACDLVRPWNDPIKDIQRKRKDKQGELLLAADQERLVGSVMYGYDGHRGSIFYLAVAPAYQGHGVGKLLMQTCEDKLHALGCPKVNLCVRESNQSVRAFYDKIGYGVDPVVVLSKRLIDD